MSKLDDWEQGRPTAPAEAERARAAIKQRRQVVLITAVAVALYVIVRLLPTGTNLSHMDFRTTGKGALEFCDPANPQFIPVVQVRSPVVMTLKSDHEPQRNQTVKFTLTLRTASGKPIAPEDLLYAHTRKLHLLVADPTLSDYQHIHPEPGRRPGEWVFTMAPKRSGIYRVFADFTPVVTARGLYASADFSVPGRVAEITRDLNNTWQAAGLNFSLAGPALFRAGQPAELRFSFESQGTVKQPLSLQPVMDAYAHLVAFDEGRSGFAHLHPFETNLAQHPEMVHPEMTFKITIPKPGRYVIWAQVKVDGNDVYVPFWLDVVP